MQKHQLGVIPPVLFFVRQLPCRISHDFVIISALQGGRVEVSAPRLYPGSSVFSKTFVKSGSRAAPPPERTRPRPDIHFP
jgi:hypothetical protein